MKQLCISTVLLVLLCPALDRGQEPANRAGEQVAPLAWPASSMKNLPADYLQRQRASLVAGTNRLGRLHFGTSDSQDSIGWIRYGLPALILGRRVDEINQFFESDKFVVSANPKFGFSLFGVSYFRLYGLMNHRTGPMKGPLSR